MSTPPTTVYEAVATIERLRDRYESRRGDLLKNAADARLALRDICARVRRLLRPFVAANRPATDDGESVVRFDLRYADSAARVEPDVGESALGMLFWFADFGLLCLRKKERPPGSRRVSTEARAWEQLVRAVQRIRKGSPDSAALDLTVRQIARRIRRSSGGVSRTEAWHLYARARRGFLRDRDLAACEARKASREETAELLGKRLEKT